MRFPRIARILPVLFLPLVAACGGTPEPPAPPENPGVAGCRAEAQAAFSSRSFARQASPGNATNEVRLERERAEAERVAFNDCLRRRGLARGGGVEPLRRPGSF